MPPRGFVPFDGIEADISVVTRPPVSLAHSGFRRRFRCFNSTGIYPRSIARRLEHVEDKVIPFVVGTLGRVEVVPIGIVNRNPHFGRIAVVQAVE